MPFLQGNFFSFKGCLNLLPFFVLGCGIERYKDLFNNKLVVRGLLVVFILAVSIHQLYLLNGKSFDRWDYAIMSFLVACPGIILLFHIRKDVPVLSKLGYYAYGIYLFHVFGTAGSRIVLMQLNITSITFLFSVGLLAGLGLPIVFEYFIEKSPLFRTVFLGLRKKTNW